MTIHFGDGTSISTEVAPSKVAQVINATKTDAWVFRYYNSWIDVGLTLNINPTAASSKIYLAMVVHASPHANSSDSLHNGLECRLLCNNQDIFTGSQADNTTYIVPSDPMGLHFLSSNVFNRVTAAHSCRGNRLTAMCQNFLHSPNSTQQQQYKIQVRRPTSQGYQLYLFGQRAMSGGAQAPSSLTAMEIRA